MKIAFILMLLFLSLVLGYYLGSINSPIKQQNDKTSQNDEQYKDKHITKENTKLKHTTTDHIERTVHIDCRACLNGDLELIKDLLPSLPNNLDSNIIVSGDETDQLSIMLLSLLLLKNAHSADSLFYLSQLFNSAPSDVKKMIIQYIGTDDYKDILFTALNDNDPAVKQAAIERLTDIVDENSISEILLETEIDTDVLLSLLDYYERTAPPQMMLEVASKILGREDVSIDVLLKLSELLVDSGQFSYSDVIDPIRNSVSFNGLSSFEQDYLVNILHFKEGKYMDNNELISFQ